MSQFTTANTGNIGYTQAELDALNAAYAARVSGAEGQGPPVTDAARATLDPAISANIAAEILKNSPPANPTPPH